MYPVKQVRFILEDYPSNIYKLIEHPNILIVHTLDQEYWSYPYDGYYKSTEDLFGRKTEIITIDCYLKVKHSRRLREAASLWKVSVADIMAVIK